MRSTRRAVPAKETPYFRHGQTYTVGYQKNELGQTTQLQYPDGSLVDRAYTPRGQLLSVDYSPAGAAASSDVADFVYDAGGRETTRNIGGSTKEAPKGSGSFIDTLGRCL